jgi:heme A synthase
VIIHQRLAHAVLLLGLVGTLWAAQNIWRRRVSPALRAYLRLTEAAIVLEAAVGVALVISGRRPSQGIHWFYGPAILLSLPVAWVLTRGSDERREALGLLAGSLAVFLFSIRALQTG